jgi:hypothetical protein
VTETRWRAIFYDRRVTSWIGTVARYGLAYGYCLLIASPILITMMFLLTGHLPFEWTLLTILVSVGMALTYGITLALAVTGILLTIPLLGSELALSYLYLEVTTEPAPPGEYSLYQFGMQGNLKQKVTASLNHSVTYQSVEIVNRIAAWVKITAESRDNPPSRA